MAVSRLNLAFCVYLGLKNAFEGKKNLSLTSCNLRLKLLDAIWICDYSFFLLGTTNLPFGKIFTNKRTEKAVAAFEKRRKRSN
jgi:hypothetical protein